MSNLVSPRLVTRPAENSSITVSFSRRTLGSCLVRPGAWVGRF